MLSILVLEDDDFQRTLLVNMLKKTQIAQVIEADSAETALNLLRERSELVDIAVCDLQLGEMDGLAFIRYVAEEELARAILVVSSHSRQVLDATAAMVRAYRVQLLGAIQKPLDPFELEHCLSTYKNKYRPISRVRVNVSESRVIEALQRQEIRAYFQPKISLQSGRVTSVEALARWHDAELGWIPPTDFVRQITRLDANDQLNTMMLEQTIEWLGNWHRRGLMIRASVNMTPDGLRRLQTADYVIEQLAIQQVEPEYLTIEITESAALSNDASTFESLSRLRMRGVSFSIDDFGTGFSSLERLLDAPFSELKVDQAFVSKMNCSKKHFALVRGSIVLAKDLGLHCVAEGVDSRSTVRLLKALRCDELQGFLFSPAIDGDSLFSFASEFAYDVSSGS